jgi:competence protein ComEC
MFNQQATANGATPCHAGLTWDWDGVRFRILHPSKWLPYLGNDSSCVISVDNGRHRTLLTGDISEAVEAGLAGKLMEHELVTVPHHGSGSSSGTAFLEATRPNLAMVSTAYGNRFGFPKPEVLDRYQRHGARVRSTSDCGALIAVFTRDRPPSMHSARATRDRPWRWSPKPDCEGK